MDGYDIIRAMAYAQRKFHPHKIAIIGSQSAYKNAKEFSSLFQFEVNIYIAPESNSLQKIINQAVKEGCDTIIGGYTVTDLAKRNSLNSVVVQTGAESISNAINEAINLNETIVAKKKESEKQRIIIDSVKDGILYLDGNGSILSFNSMASTILGKSLSIDEDITIAFPFMSSHIKKCMESKTEERNVLHVWEGISLSSSYIPVIIDGNAVASIIVFQDISYIQKLEKQIRYKLSERGLNARYCFHDIVHKSSIMSETVDIAKNMHYLPLTFLLQVKPV